MFFRFRFFFIIIIIMMMIIQHFQFMELGRNIDGALSKNREKERVSGRVKQEDGFGTGWDFI